MKFGELPLQHAEGAILAHSVKHDGGMFKKGRTLTADDIALLTAFTQQQRAAGVAIGKIDLGSGTAGYKGDPDVQRYALTPEDITAFATYNAANPSKPVAAAGRILSRNQPFLNLSSSEHSGVDFGLRYELPLPFIEGSHFSASLVGTALLPGATEVLDRATTFTT